ASMVARHEDRLAKWRDAMQENLVKNIEHGLALTRSQIGRAERLRTELWERVRVFQERFDLILTPTAAVPPFPVEWRSGPKEINGEPMPTYIDWAMLTYAFTVVGLAGNLRACRLHEVRPPRRPADRRPLARRGRRPARGRRLRGHAAVGRPPAARNLVVPLAVAELDEEPVRLTRMHPRDVRARTVDLHAARAQLRHRAGDVGTLEADEINALAALGEKSSDGL